MVSKNSKTKPGEKKKKSGCGRRTATAAAPVKSDGSQNRSAVMGEISYKSCGISTGTKIQSQAALSAMKSNQSIGMSHRTASLSSMASRYNLNASGGRFTAASASELREMMQQSTGCCINQFGESLYECVVLYLICPNHKKLALSEVVNKGLFLPFGPVRSGESWLLAAMRLIQRTLKVKISGRPSFHEPTILDIVRIQLPIYFEFISRIVYCIQLTDEACRSHGLCQDNAVIAWFGIDEIGVQLPAVNYLGPEPGLFRPSASLHCREVTIFDVVFYFHQDRGSPEARLLIRTGYKETDLLKLYSDFLQHCYPSEFMSIFSFKTFLERWEFNIPNPNDVFRSFAFNGKSTYLCFTEFLLGLAAIDKSIMNQNSTKITVDEFFSGYYFRYYAKKPDAQYLTDAEVQRLMADLCYATAGNDCKSKRAVAAASMSKLLLECCGRAAGTATAVTKQTVHLLLNSLANRYGSVADLFRCCSSPLSYLRSRNCYPALQLKQIAASDTKSAIHAKLQRAKEFCVNCRSKQYTLAVHIVKMSSDGNIYEPVVNNQADVERMVSHKRILSCRYFTKSFVCNQMIDMIRDFAVRAKIAPVESGSAGGGSGGGGSSGSGAGSRQSGGRRTSSLDWYSVSGGGSGLLWRRCTDKIIKICQEAKKLFQNCSTVIKVTSPCYIIGDLHGNLHDLLVYERTIWKLGPYFTPANYLFLGDYVDRGDYSVETILYLLCMKLLVPDRIFMLRGNHECRSLQKEFTFYHECRQKFDDRGEEIWEIFNDVFDVMPLCAIIDESIFCAHGGIPSCAQRLEQIMAIRTPLKDPENESDIALEILWNDPVTNQEYLDLLKNTPSIIAASSSAANESSPPPSVRPSSPRIKMPPEGFLLNTKRGTACYYSEDALNNFMTANSLTHVIRAHEVIPSGYQYHMGGRCITIFSCSHYCGGINEAAVALAFDSKIRVIKFDMR